MLRNVAVIVMDGVAAFELGVLCEVFGTDRTADGFPGYRFDLCSPDGGPVRTQNGFGLTPAADLTPVDDADLVAVPAHKDGYTVPPSVLDALRRADARGAQVLSVCSGAFVLGEAGLLDDRECTTHWR
ncbi:MAG TPA: DJ-1/PfpI family protein, partial [Asanoa sp.]|nr:DJ-1/PfpI family protein [Asanoa sp.]